MGMPGGDQAGGYFQGDTALLRPSEGGHQTPWAGRRVPDRQNPAHLLKEQTCPILHQHSSGRVHTGPCPGSVGPWALPLGAHMDIWTNRKCCFLWKAGLDSFSPSRQLWGFYAGHPTPRPGGRASHGSSLEGVEQTGSRRPSLSAFLGKASQWGKALRVPTRRRLPSLQASSIHRGALGHSPSCTPYKITHDASPPSPGTTHLLLSL